MKDNEHMRLVKIETDNLGLGCFDYKIRLLYVEEYGINSVSKP